MTPHHDAVLAAAERATDELRDELREQYGWTRLDVQLVHDEVHRALRVRGTVLAPRVAHRLAAALSDTLPDGVQLDTRGLKPFSTGNWHTLPSGVTALWQKHPSRGLVLSTELLPGDGPVELLAHHDGARLVRAMDGTVGWVEHELGGRRSAPAIAPAHGTGEQVLAAARALLDAPYRLGGTTLSGVDCSGLVQRAHREGLGVLLPRHSMDQLAATLRSESAPRQSGDLVFAWSEQEGPCHVGILSCGSQTTVVHASVSRKRVVEDAWERFIERTSRVELSAVGHVLEFHAENIGRASVDLVHRWVDD